jgi:hypothetical protein
MKLINLIFVGALLPLASCGGGSDQGEKQFLAERYLLSPQSLVEDSCRLGLPTTLSDTTVLNTVR